MQGNFFCFFELQGPSGVIFANNSLVLAVVGRLSRNAPDIQVIINVRRTYQQGLTFSSVALFYFFTYHYAGFLLTTPSVCTYILRSRIYTQVHGFCCVPSASYITRGSIPQMRKISRMCDPECFGSSCFESFIGLKAP